MPEKSKLSIEDLVITRLFNAPRELVWKAWTDAEQLVKWWGPKGFKMGVSRLELKPGGEFLYSMQGPEGGPLGDAVLWGKFVYRDIMEPDWMVFVNSFSNEKGEKIRHPLSPTWPLEVLNVMTLTEQEGKTMLTLKGGPINASENDRQTFLAGVEGMQKGFAGTFDQLDEYLVTHR